MSVLQAIRDRFAGREATAKTAEQARRQRYVELCRLVADGGANIDGAEAVLAEVRCTPDDLAADVERLVQRRELARQAMAVPALEAQVAVLTDRSNAARAAAAAKQQWLEDELRAINAESVQLNRALEPGRQALYKITNEARREFAGILAAAEAEVSRDAQRAAALAATMAEERGRIQHFQAAENDPGRAGVIATAEGRIRTFEAEAKAIEKRLPGLRARVAKLKDQVATIEQAALERALRGELPPPVAPATTEAPARRELTSINMP